MDRTGVAGVAKDNGTVDHIVLDDLYIHNVTGNVYNKHMTNGGIYFIVETPTNEATTGIARYNDVQIKNCYLDTVNRWGIAVGYTYQWRQFQTGALSDATMAKYGSSNVVIENNYLNHVGWRCHHNHVSATDRWFNTMCQRTQLNRLIQKTTHSSSQVWMQMEMRLVNRTLEQDVWQQVSGHGNVKMRSSVQ